MSGVFGNNDQERASLEAAIERYGFDFYEPPFEVVWDDRAIIVVHDPLEFDGHLSQQAIALHGHTHRCRCGQTPEQLIFNPGECAGTADERPKCHWGAGHSRFVYRADSLLSRRATGRLRTLDSFFAKSNP